MKAVFFCGGQGMRLHPSTVNVPKPLVNVGHQPILYHLMKAYAYYGHKDFILCLGYKGNELKKYFLEFNDALSSDVIMRPGALHESERIEILHKNMQDWKITFVDTGLTSNVGQRLLRIRKYVEDEPFFLVNYADALSNIDLSRLVEDAIKYNKIGYFITVKPPSSFHLVVPDDEGHVKSLTMIEESHLRINGGWFVFKNEIFDYIKEGEDLTHEPFKRLIEKNQLMVHDFAKAPNWFWASMDTYKDKSKLDDLASKPNPPWEVWKENIKGTY
jgi:glucose-1-phosphate cytidylyltransferase